MAKPLMISANGPKPFSAGGKISSTAPIPTRPRLATERPMTAPPLNATRRAFPRPSERAASVVRTFARVAACMPKKPARIELAAPKTYAAAVRDPMTK
ncbi:MAG: hypothetical protein P8Y07_04340 [Gemmatimonadales bacterium]